MYKNTIKPVFDFLISFLLLLLTAPLILLTALYLAIANKGKIWFIQQRAGEGERG